MTVIRTLALFGFGVSAYLVWMKLTGQITSVVGCGGDAKPFLFQTQVKFMLG